MLLQFALGVLLTQAFLVKADGKLPMHIIPRQNVVPAPRSLQSPPPNLEHVPRAAAGTTVNWATMPVTYAAGVCDTANGTVCVTNSAHLNDSISSDECLTYDLPCQPVNGTCRAPNGTIHACLTYSLDCYCNLRLQLQCAWKFFTWLDWMYTEDWLQKQCPSIQPVDFSLAPSCASSCLQDKSLKSGCITGGRNCFCFQQSFFNCDMNCKPEDMDGIYSWYAGECDMTLDNATYIVNNGSITRTIFASAKSGTIHWYEIVAFLAASTSFVLLVVGWLVDPLMRQRIHNRLNPKRHWD